IVHVYVDGREVDRIHFTNVDVVFPQEPIKGPDTPEGMPDRISAGDDGNWGTYLGEIQVYPNLYGLHALDFDVVGPDDDPKWGDAQVEAVAYDELDHSYFVVAGTVGTAPPAGPGQPLNAPFLQVVAQLAQQPAARVQGRQRFAVAGIPVSAVQIDAAVERGFEDGNDWSWGVYYTVRLDSDGGPLTGIW